MPANSKYISLLIRLPNLRYKQFHERTQMLSMTKNRVVNDLIERWLVATSEIYNTLSTNLSQKSLRNVGD